MTDSQQNYTDYNEVLFDDWQHPHLLKFDDSGDPTMIQPVEQLKSINMLTDLDHAESEIDNVCDLMRD